MPIQKRQAPNTRQWFKSIISKVVHPEQLATLKSIEEACPERAPLLSFAAVLEQSRWHQSMQPIVAKRLSQKGVRSDHTGLFQFEQFHLLLVSRAWFFSTILRYWRIQGVDRDYLRHQNIASGKQEDEM